MLKDRNNIRQLPWFTLSFGVAAAVLGLLPEHIQGFFQFDRDEVLKGEYWRLFTGHFVHWNMDHLFWDLSVFLICGGLLEWFRRPFMVGISILGAVIVSLGLLFLQPEMIYYRGLSAIDMGLVAAFCLIAISYCRLRNRKVMERLWCLCLGACLVKPVLEAFLGTTFFVSEFGWGIQASPLSHVFGILTGLIIASGIFLWKRFLNRPGYNHTSQTHRPSEISIF
ncbi:MAG: rhombosortase [Verrucomicrobia bacterium]|nr:rhombosortase [Verrucomicrobiota bacterium]